MEDISIQIESVNERIQLLQRQLDNTMQRKALLLEEVKQLEKLEQDLQMKLKEESEFQAYFINSISLVQSSDELVQPKIESTMLDSGTHLVCRKSARRTKSGETKKFITADVENVTSGKNRELQEQEIKMKEYMGERTIRDKLREKLLQKAAIVANASDDQDVTDSSSSRTDQVSNRILTGTINPVKNGFEDTAVKDKDLEDKPIICEICFKEIISPDTLEKHRKSDHPDDTKCTFTCQVCNINFQGSQDFTEHVCFYRSVHKKSVVKECMQKKRGRKKSVQKKSHYVCHECGDKDFCTRQRYQKHMVKHITGERPRPFACEQCGKGFYEAYTLKLHLLRDHLGQNKYLCNICGKGLVDMSYLKRHLLVHTKKYECDICGKKFVNERRRREHRLVHTGEFPFVCTVCGSGQRTRTSLKNHMLTHGGTKSHVCTICSKSFLLAIHLRAHMRSHTGEKAYKCRDCPERFYSDYRLRLHQQKSHGNLDSKKLYSCTLCDKTFVVPNALKVHLAAHSNEAPYLCDLCDKRYKQSKDLTIHKRKVHSVACVKVSGATETLNGAAKASVDYMDVADRRCIVIIPSE